VILYLNNLENLSEAEADGAADILRSLRDIVFQCDFLHVFTSVQEQGPSGHKTRLLDTYCASGHENCQTVE
jgi:hypothetical protein